jgi:glucose-1-phosphate adenylyltransferase
MKRQKIERNFMPDTGRQSINTSNVLSVIMGGGQGTRLFPSRRNALNPRSLSPASIAWWIFHFQLYQLRSAQGYLLTQFNSASLHRHISQSYKFDHFSGGFVEILAAEQTFSDASWYQGTADAVRKNTIHFRNHDWDFLLILSGDQLYRMDFREIIRQHAETNADITIATIPVARREASSLGIMQMDIERRITRFVEKPGDPAVQDSLRLDPAWYPKLGIKEEGELFLASMGIYVFKRDVLFKLLDNSLSDFGKDIIPNAISNYRVFLLHFSGILGRYWYYPRLFRGKS